LHIISPYHVTADFTARTHKQATSRSSNIDGTITFFIGRRTLAAALCTSSDDIAKPTAVLSLKLAVLEFDMRALVPGWCTGLLRTKGYTLSWDCRLPAGFIGWLGY
jgi:hypothetical protein